MKGPAPMDLRVRFDRYVVKGDGCWLWTGPFVTAGYGALTVRRDGKPKSIGAHRLAWEFEHGCPVPPGLFVCHHCDNPPCVNPAHLFIGTARDNVRDMMQKGRHPIAARTHCDNGHEFTVENTRLQGNERVCRKCGAERIARFRERKRHGVNAA